VTGAAPTETRHIGTLDGVRAVAAYGVIATHAGFNSGRSLDNGPFAPLLARLDFGVTLFFLLSGFLLFRPFAVAALTNTPGPRVGSFWWRRFLRIAPAYWLTIVVVLGVLTTQQPTTRGEWRSYLLLTQTYDGHNIDSSLTRMWTLATEIGFYAALPLLAIAARRLGSRRPQAGQLGLVAALGVGALAASLINQAIAGDYSAGRLWLPVYLDWFGLGMLLAIASIPVDHPARLVVTLRELARAPGTCWIFGALLFWISTLPIAGPRNLLAASWWEFASKHYLYGAAAFFFLLPVALGSAGWIRRLLGNRFMSWLGAISYGVYLWHLPLLIAIQHWLGWHTFGGHFLELFVLTTLAATAAAAASWYLLERPLLRRLSRPWRRPDRPRREGHQPQRNQAEQLDAGASGERVG
jgi:peptidoglycan/LPS O-acetylase OafA/YrhL